MDGKPSNQKSIMDQRNTMARKRNNQDVMQRSVHEDASKPWWGPQGGSAESLQPPKRASEKVELHSARAQDKPDVVPSPVASPTPWHTVRTWGKNQAEKHDVTGSVRSRVTRNGGELHGKKSSLRWPMRSRFPIILPETIIPELRKQLEFAKSCTIKGAKTSLGL